MPLSDKLVGGRNLLVHHCLRVASQKSKDQEKKENDGKQGFGCTSFQANRDVREDSLTKYARG